MNIGYRRYSGKAFTTAEQITSKRGAWFEKRMALLSQLARRSNEISFIENGQPYDSYDIVLVEFGSLNTMFYKEDIDYSEEILSKAKKVVFILDDPDLMPMSMLKKHLDVPIWVNANPKKCSRYWKRGDFKEFPIYGYQDAQEPRSEHNGKIVYYGGTSGGRERLLMKYKALLPNLEVYGAEKDYTYIKPWEPPAQHERADFYARFMGCLGLVDKKHKRTGWNTGRITHAILAWCPAVLETPGFLEVCKNLENKEYRDGMLQAQREMISEAQKKCDNLFDEYGM